MTDNDFIDLVSNEFKTSITSEEVPIYKKAILNVAKILNSENKKCKEIIKRTFELIKNALGKNKGKVLTLDQMRELHPLVKDDRFFKTTFFPDVKLDEEF